MPAPPITGIRPLAPGGVLSRRPRALPCHGRWTTANKTTLSAAGRGPEERGMDGGRGGGGKVGLEYNSFWPASRLYWLASSSSRCPHRNITSFSCSVSFFGEELSCKTSSSIVRYTHTEASSKDPSTIPTHTPHAYIRTPHSHHTTRHTHPFPQPPLEPEPDLNPLVSDVP